MKRSAPSVGPSGEEESEQLASWRAAPRRPGEAFQAELPSSLKRARVDREVPLAAEVVRRERLQEVAVSIQAAAALDPDRRAKWLCRALEAVAAGSARASDVYDVLSHPRFEHGVSAAVARRMMDEARKRAELFPERLREAIISDKALGLAKLATTAAASGAGAGAARAAGAAGGSAGADAAMAEEMLRRCTDFVRHNEARLAQVHELDARSFQVELKRENVQQVWGLTWSRAAFAAQRRVLEGIVMGTPAGGWNEEQAARGERPMRPGDELIAVGGRRGWEAMAVIRELTEASLTFVRTPSYEDAATSSSSTASVKVSQALQPPLVSQGGYSVDAGSGWRGHMGGQWLYNDADGVYFHVGSGMLLLEDPATPGSFLRLNSDGGGGVEGGASLAECNGGGDSGGGGAAVEGSAPRLLGKMRWFSKPKGFGFVTPWSAEPTIVEGTKETSSQDLFVHRSQVLEPLTEHGLSEVPSAPLLPGTPVTYLPAVQEDGKPCAAQVCQVEDLDSLCQAGFSTSSSARRIEKVSVEVKAHGGQTSLAPFAGVACGVRGAGGAEYVALHAARDLASCLRGREQFGERGARAALAAALRQTQHGFLQYARRLSENSADRWLAAETTACIALLFAPEADGRPRLLLATVGGGRGIIGRRDGSVVARLGGSPAPSTGGSSSSGSTANGQDNFKVFERGLKGPAISFPSGMYRAAGAPAPQPAPKGFGAHAWSDRDGGAAGLEFEIHSHALDWQEDALLILGSDAFWKLLPNEEEVIQLAMKGCRRPGRDQEPPQQQAAEMLMDAARLARLGRPLPDDAAVAVLRFTWSQLPAGCSEGGEEDGNNGVGAAGASAADSAHAAGHTQGPAGRRDAADASTGDDGDDGGDDMFAPARASEDRRAGESDMFAAPAGPAEAEAPAVAPVGGDLSCVGEPRVPLAAVAGGCSADVPARLPGRQADAAAAAAEDAPVADGCVGTLHAGAAAAPTEEGEQEDENGEPSETRCSDGHAQELAPLSGKEQPDQQAENGGASGDAALSAGGAGSVEGPSGELDDMFAEFCREISGI